METFFSAMESAVYRHVYFVNNAGSLTPILPLTNIPPQQIIDYVHLNITSTILLVKAFVQAVQRLNVRAATLINISSLWAVEPAQDVSLYCIAKSARDMLSRVVALEVSSSIMFYILNLL